MGDSGFWAVVVAFTIIAFAVQSCDADKKFHAQVDRIEQSATNTESRVEAIAEKLNAD